MRHISLLFAVVLLLGLAVLAPLAPAFAQESTPQAEEELPPGVAVEVLSYGTLLNPLPAVNSLLLFRIRIEPGAAYSFDARGSGFALAYVEAGAVTARVEGPLAVLRAAATEDAFPSQMEVFPAGTNFTMSVGDSVIIPPYVGGELSNAGNEPVALLVTLVTPAQDDGVGTPVAATPTT